MRDHNPPHFHALVAEFEAIIVIEDFSIYAGFLPQKYMSKVLEWGVENKEYLSQMWKVLNKENAHGKKNN